MMNMIKLEKQKINRVLGAASAASSKMEESAMAAALAVEVLVKFEICREN